MKDLIERLRNSRSCDELCDEAAEHIEKLEAENAALKIRLDVTLDNYGHTARERDALKEELAAMHSRSRTPVAYITETEQGPMVWTPEMYGEACTYCDDGEFPMPLVKL